MNLELLLIMLGYSTPAIVLGALIGGWGWRQHPLFGALIGGLIGTAIGLLFWLYYLNSDLSVHFDPGELLLTGLRRGWPGILIGAVIGFYFCWRRVFGALCGGTIGFLPGLLVWWLLYG